MKEQWSITSSRTPPSHCPECKTRIDGITGAAPGASGGPVPKPGSLSLCAYCGTILQFDADMKLVRANEEDAARALRENEMFRRVVEQWRADLARRRKSN